MNQSSLNPSCNPISIQLSPLRLSQAQSTSQTLTEQTAASHLATVMGAGSQTGMPTVEQLEAALKQASTLTGCQDKDNVYRVLAEHVQTVVDNTVKKAIDSAAAATSSFMAADTPNGGITRTGLDRSV